MAATAIIATLIFALPPAVRLTSLGIRAVPPTALEVAGSFGSTRRQTLRKVQLPMAKPSIMLGVNQTIMMAMGMVVIAAFVGAPGLGRDVLDGLQQLNVGEALNGGIAIVAMAIVLDRVSYAWSLRDRTPQAHDRAVRPVVHPPQGAIIARPRDGRRGRDRPPGATPAGVARELDVSVAEPANAIVDWIQSTFSGDHERDQRLV